MPDKDDKGKKVKTTTLSLAKIAQDAAALVLEIKVLIEELEAARDREPKPAKKKATRWTILNESHYCAKLALATAQETTKDANSPESRMDLIFRTKQKLAAMELARTAHWMTGNFNPEWNTVMGNNHWVCEYCPTVLDEDENKFFSASKDHIIPWSAGGLNSEPNLVAACSVCNSLKGHWVPDSSVNWGDRAEYIEAVKAYLRNRRTELKKDFDDHHKAKGAAMAPATPVISPISRHSAPPGAKVVPAEAPSDS